MALAGLTPLPSIKVKPPRVAESALHMECVLRHVYEVEDKDGRPSTAVVIGEVVQFHVAEAVTARSPTGKLVVDPVALRPVSRLGGVTYGLTTHLFNLARPDKSGKYGPAAPA